MTELSHESARVVASSCKKSFYAQMQSKLSMLSTFRLWKLSGNCERYIEDSHRIPNGTTLELDTIPTDIFSVHCAIQSQSSHSYSR